MLIFLVTAALSKFNTVRLPWQPAPVMTGLPDRGKCLVIYLAVSIPYTSLAVGRTDRQTDGVTDSERRLVLRFASVAR